MEYQVPNMYYTAAGDSGGSADQQQQQQQQQQVILVRAVEEGDSSDTRVDTSLDQYHFYNDPVISKWRRVPSGPSSALLIPRMSQQPPQLRKRVQQPPQAPKSVAPASFIVTPTGELQKQRKPVSILKNSKTVTFNLAEEPGAQDAIPQPRFDRRQTNGAISPEEVAAAVRAYQRQESQPVTLIVSNGGGGPVGAAETPKIVVQDENESVFYKEFTTDQQAAPQAAAVAAAAAAKSRSSGSHRVRSRDRARFEEVADLSSDEEDRAARMPRGKRSDEALKANSALKASKSSTCAVL